MRATTVTIASFLIAFTGCAGRSAPWYGQGCDCSSAPASRPPHGSIAGQCNADSYRFHNVITEGDNVLVVDFVHVYDNAEGKKPDGSGTNWGWMGPIPWKHGPIGNLHIRIYGDDGRELRHLRNLPGPNVAAFRVEGQPMHGVSEFRNLGLGLDGGHNRCRAHLRKRSRTMART